ncbi:MAG: VOC family protein [Spirochaetia bacterium]|jgi:PhnB protein
MGVSAYLNFDGNCREAVNHYTRVFGTEAPRIMTFGETPPNPSFPMDDATKKLVMHAEIDIAGTTIMFGDVPPGMKYVQGNDITLIVQSKNPDDITRWFNGMKQGGSVRMELGPQFWSRLYGFVTDKFGIGWQFGLVEEQSGSRQR